jgi:hypothetical protein
VIYQRCKQGIVESPKPVAYAIDGEVFRIAGDIFFANPIMHETLLPNQGVVESPLVWTSPKITFPTSTATSCFSAFGAALVGSLFSMVDMAMMGHYQGPMPQRLWPSFRLYGTSSTLWASSPESGPACFMPNSGARDKPEMDPNAYFTSGLILTLIICRARSRFAQRFFSRF